MLACHNTSGSKLSPPLHTCSIAGHVKQLAKITPYQVLLGVPPDFTHLRVFGCLYFPNLAATAPNKLSACSSACVLLGYPLDHRGYRCFDLATRRVITSRHVTFDESQFPFLDEQSVSSSVPSDTIPHPTIDFIVLPQASPAQPPVSGSPPVNVAQASPPSSAPSGVPSPSSAPSSSPVLPVHPMLTRAHAYPHHAYHRCIKALADTSTRCVQCVPSWQSS